MMVCDQLVLLIETCSETVVVIGPIDIMLDVLFPAPNDFHWPIDVLGDRDRLGDAVNVEPSPKAAAEQMVVNLDLLGRKPGHLRSRGLRPGSPPGFRPRYRSCPR